MKINLYCVCVDRCRTNSNSVLIPDANKNHTYCFEPHSIWYFRPNINIDPPIFMAAVGSVNILAHFVVVKYCKLLK
jgi:hypothetical protein